MLKRHLKLHGLLVFFLFHTKSFSLWLLNNLYDNHCVHGVSFSLCLSVTFTKPNHVRMAKFYGNKKRNAR